MRFVSVLSVLLALAAVGAGTASAARSWAQPQIKAVVRAGLLAKQVPAFQPTAPLTQGALATALEELDARREDGVPVPYRYPTPNPGAPVSLGKLDAALVGFLGLGDAARQLTDKLRTAGLKPPAGTSTEVIARMLGLRYNHPAGSDDLELFPNEAATRAEGAYSLARMLELTGWETEWVRSRIEELTLPALTPGQRQVLQRAVSLVGSPYVWGGESVAEGGYDCSGFVWAVYRLHSYPSAPALAGLLHGRTAAAMAGEVGPARRIRKVAQLEPGDLVFQTGTRRKTAADVNHASIYFGGGWIIHSSRYGTTMTPFEGWYRDAMVWGRRPLREAGLA
jgi:cell wall-associated NlpC family hydrolase